MLYALSCCFLFVSVFFSQEVMFFSTSLVVFLTHILTQSVAGHSVSPVVALKDGRFYLPQPDCIKIAWMLNKQKF